MAKCVKLDVEEAENEVIRGAVALLKRSRPLIFIEIGKKALAEREPESLRFLRSIGYTFFTLRRHRLQPLSGQFAPGTNVTAIPDAWI